MPVKRFLLLVACALTAISNLLAAPPDWSKDAIWYQIFPERFRNGDKSNDPTKETLKDTWPYEPVRSWKISPWTADWYKLQPWESENGKGFYYNAQRRRYGGDLQGILDKLDYLKKIGVNSLYLNPIFESPSLHKYGASYYHHIDNNFGPDPSADTKTWKLEDPSSPETWKWTSADQLFLQLIRECHKRGMRIIIDGVFNHVGISFWALQKAKQEGPESDYADWFSIKRWDDPRTSEDEFEYEGWAGIKDLPVFKHGPRGPNDSVKSHFRSVLKRWMDPNGDGDPSDGVDGWRLDVAAEVPIDFWKEFRTWAKEINPESYLTGEIWWEDYNSIKLENASRWLQGDTFDAVMNYRFADTTYQFFNQSTDPLNASGFAKELNQLYFDYGYDISLSLQNLLNSHDTQRLASMVANPKYRLDQGANLKSNRAFTIDSLKQENHAKLLQIVAFQFLSPGAPYIYYGDEVGMWGADDPDCRKPMLWTDFNYEDEFATPFGPPRRQGIKVRQNTQTLKFFTKLCQLRNQFSTLRRGKFRILLSDDTKRSFAFERADKKRTFVAIFNASAEPIPMPDLTRDLKLSVSSKGTSSIILGANGFAVFVK